GARGRWRRRIIRGLRVVPGAQSRGSSFRSAGGLARLAWAHGSAAAGFASVQERRVFDATVSQGIGAVSRTAVFVVDGLLWQRGKEAAFLRGFSAATGGGRSVRGHRPARAAQRFDRRFRTAAV